MDSFHSLIYPSTIIGATEEMTPGLEDRSAIILSSRDKILLVPPDTEMIMHFHTGYFSLPETKLIGNYFLLTFCLTKPEDLRLCRMISN